MKEQIKKAALLLKDGQLVAFPTETVYGLGADATNDTAVASIYEKKGRPSFNPLIAHVDGIEMAKQYVQITPVAKKLIENFWPGPLTLVLKRKKTCKVSLLASAGLDTLAIRCPNNHIALELISEFGKPVVAPSANKSGRISPTTAKHIFDDYGNEAPFTLDGGPCQVGVESTVLLCEEDKIAVLRYGGLAIEEIENLIGPVIRPEKDENAPHSPGQLKSHYAPSLPVRINAIEAFEGEALLGFGKSDSAVLNLSEKEDLTEAAANLFAMMHMLDNPKYTGIAVMPIPMQGLGLAINDRLKRASYKKD
ncbi:MAG: threonylcarbamoyl-AMP synthase [Alphaproteobacteria bacterium]|nr:threonylcarbamoyl-AMP synthase [Alphaproteobacteria bacterium]